MTACLGLWRKWYSTSETQRRYNIQVLSGLKGSALMSDDPLKSHEPTREEDMGRGLEEFAAV